ncbi:hypothetical protein OS175_08065 [Marinicella sp. S1101]|uniref:hypothetical protein n=1 Tax=Marinicella marina TaxID=2996016 RepID=UPI002260A1DA|nr:hypothetical protein [Marinicella marina]MCX7553830.1 hypothetical protein [Marinicella marina]MDJ1140906.1 hypothetical protein [Marinicella marina]
MIQKIITILLIAYTNSTLAISYPQMYPHELQKEDAAAIINQAEKLDIPRTSLIEKVKSYALSPDGHGAHIQIQFEHLTISPGYKQQSHLYCGQEKTNETVWNCQSYKEYSIKSDYNEKWIDIKSKEQMPIELLQEFILYAEKVKPVSWKELNNIKVTTNFGYQACFGPVSFRIPSSCLSIERTFINDENHYTVNWSSLFPLSWHY